MRVATDKALARLDSAIQAFKPVAVFGLFSGGHDSLTATKVASLHPKFTAAVHINTGIGVEATREFVHRTASKEGWRLLEYKAADNTDKDGNHDPQRYEDFVMQFGFPGPFGHGMMYARLKERQLRKLGRDFNASPERPILLVSGCRSEESRRRMGNTQEVQVLGQRIWCAPIHDFSKLQTTEFLTYHRLERNPVVDLIHKSGECLCGAFAEPGELAELAMWPETRPAYERIIALQKKVRAAGFPWDWEEGPPEWWLEKNKGQTFLLDYDTDEPMHLCWSCTKGVAA